MTARPPSRTSRLGCKCAKIFSTGVLLLVLDLRLELLLLVDILNICFAAGVGFVLAVTVAVLAYVPRYSQLVFCCWCWIIVHVAVGG
jgi:hypothetical protein